MKPTVTTDQVKRFQADGVVFLEGFFPQEYIDSLTKGIQKNLEDPGPRKHVWNKEPCHYYFYIQWKIFFMLEG